MYLEELRIAYEFSNGRLFPVILAAIIFSETNENFHFQKTEIKTCVCRGGEKIFNIRFNLANLTFLLGELSKSKQKTNTKKHRYDVYNREI